MLISRPFCSTVEVIAGGLLPPPVVGGGNVGTQPACLPGGGDVLPGRVGGVLMSRPSCSTVRAIAGDLVPPPEGGGGGAGARAACLSCGGVGRPGREGGVLMSRPFPGCTSATITMVLVGVWGGISFGKSGDSVDFTGGVACVLLGQSCRLSWAGTSLGQNDGPSRMEHTSTPVGTGEKVTECPGVIIVC